MKTKFALLATVFILVLGVTACGPIYSNAPGPPTPPAVVGMEWAHPGDAGSTECGLGLLADGSAFLSGAFGHPFLAAGITWLGWKITGRAQPPGGSLADCWDYAQWNIYEFNVYTQCYGQPVLKSTWTSFSNAQAWISIPTCRQCNQACQRFASFANSEFDYNANYCDSLANILDLVCFVISHPNGAAVADSETTDPPPGTTTDLPWPSDFAPPGWDVNAPIGS